MTNPDQSVAYSVKELLAIQNEALGRIERKVDEGNLRQTEAIARIDTRVAILEQRPDLEPRIRALEEARSEGRGEREYRRFIVPTLCGVLVAVGAFAPFVHF